METDTRVSQTTGFILNYITNDLKQHKNKNWCASPKSASGVPLATPHQVWSISNSAQATPEDLHCHCKENKACREAFLVLDLNGERK